MIKDIELITPQLIEKCCIDRVCKVTDEFILFNKCEDLPFTTIPRQVNGIFIILNLEGTMKMNIADRDFTLEENDTIVVNFSQIIRDYSYSRDCRSIAIYGTPSFFQEVGKNWYGLSNLFIFLRDRAKVKLSDQGVKVFREYFNVIQERAHWKEHRFIKPVTTMLFCSMVFDLGDILWDLHDHDVSMTVKKSDKLFAEFVSLVEKNFRTQRRVSWYASQIGITPKYLSDIVRNSSKQTPIAWIDKYVVMEIRFMLRNSAMSVKEITEELKFPNQSFLGKFFKQHTGMSPSEYRKH